MKISTQCSIVYVLRCHRSNLHAREKSGGYISYSYWKVNNNPVYKAITWIKKWKVVTVHCSKNESWQSLSIFHNIWQINHCLISSSPPTGLLKYFNIIYHLLKYFTKFIISYLTCKLCYFYVHPLHCCFSPPLSPQCGWLLKAVVPNMLYDINMCQKFIHLRQRIRPLSWILPFDGQRFI